MTAPTDKPMRAIPADRIERLGQLVSKACRDAAVNEDERSYELWIVVRRELRDAPEVAAPSAARTQVSVPSYIREPRPEGCTFPHCLCRPAQISCEKAPASSERPAGA
jgi:hypothetical protein